MNEPTVPRDASRVADGLHCARCGYDLRDLPVDSQCPECGESIRSSIDGRWLRHANREWVQQVTWGMDFLDKSRRSVVGSFFVMLGAVLFGGAVIAPSQDSWIEDAVNVMIWISRASLFVCAVGMATGLWLASAPEPLIDEDNSWMRRIYRVAGALTVPAFGLLAYSHRLFTSPPVQLAVIQLLFLIVMVHLLGMTRLADELESRCRKLPRRQPGQIPGVMMLAGLAWVLYWAGPVRMSRSGSWTLPDFGSTRTMLFALGFVWFVMASRFHLTLRAIRDEIATSDPGNVSEAPSVPTTAN